MKAAGFAIWPPYEVFYIHGMLFNARAAVRSISSINALIHDVLQHGRAAIEKIDQTDALNEVQNILLHGAALSRYFWPVRKGHDDRAVHLRRSLEVRDDSPLRSRGLRNAVEHFDERLDHYLEAPIVGAIVPNYFGPTPTDDGVPLHLFRAYFVDTGVFQLLDQRVNVEPVAQEIWRIWEELESCDRQGGRLRIEGRSTPHP
jgi:hypothetical protein